MGSPGKYLPEDANANKNKGVSFTKDAARGKKDSGEDLPGPASYGVAQTIQGVVYHTSCDFIVKLIAIQCCLAISRCINIRFLRRAVSHTSL